MAYTNSHGMPPIRTPQSTENFQEYQENDTTTPSSQTNMYQSITFMLPHQDFSFEELRMNDYAHDRGVINRPSPAFSAFPTGISLAVVRYRLNEYTKPPFARRTLASHSLNLGSKVVLFQVGKNDPQEFSIHENLIVPASEFVKVALSKNWKEGKERKVPLPDDDPQVFGLLQDWLYAKKVPSMYIFDGAKDMAEYKQLVQAYILGDKFGIIDFKDAVIDSIILKLRFTASFDPRLANLVYDNTLEGSPLRRLWQDIYVWAGNPNWLDEAQMGDFISAEFALDLSRYQMRMIRGQGATGPPYEDVSLGVGCVYHEHKRSECYRGSL